MTFVDDLMSISIVFALLLILYLKVTKKGLKETLEELRDFFQESASEEGVIRTKIGEIKRK